MEKINNCFNLSQLRCVFKIFDCFEYLVFTKYSVLILKQFETLCYRVIVVNRQGRGVRWAKGPASPTCTLCILSDV